MIGNEVQGRRKRLWPKRRYLESVRDDNRQKGLSGEEMYNRATWRHILSYVSTPCQSATKMKRKKVQKKKKKN